MVVTIFDSFEFREGMTGSSHPAGLVVLFDAAALPQVPGVGVIVSVCRADGTSFDAPIEEVKKHGEAAWSYFFAGLHKKDAPRGSKIIWSDDNRQWRLAAAVQASGGKN
jgi:hypothetical protein